MMLLGHGLPKLLNFAVKAESFPDPIGWGSQASLAAAIFAEIVCSLAVALGLFTRWACVPLVFLLLVVVFIIHADDPWGKKEMALLYVVPFISLIFLGGGRFSLDRVLLGKR